MGILKSSYSVSALDHYWQRSDRQDIFKLSDVSSRFLKANKIDMTIKDFKKLVRNSKPFARVRTGGVNYQMRSTPLYKISELKKNIKK